MTGAVINPGTVVVHLPNIRKWRTYLKNTKSSSLTMLSSCGLPSFFALAFIAELYLHVLWLKRRLETFWNPTRIRTRCPQVSDYCQHTHPIESDAIVESPPSQRNTLYKLISETRPVVPVEDGEPIRAVHPIHDQEKSLIGSKMKIKDLQGEQGLCRPNL
jgi:hypothetical protein